MHELQEETLQHIKGRHGHPDSAMAEQSGNNKGATSGEERVDAYEATYERDEMTGPLKHTVDKESKERDTFKQRIDRKESDLPGGV